MCWPTAMRSYQLKLHLMSRRTAICRRPGPERLKWNGRRDDERRSGPGRPASGGRSRDHGAWRDQDRLAGVDGAGASCRRPQDDGGLVRRPSVLAADVLGPGVCSRRVWWRPADHRRSRRADRPGTRVRRHDRRHDRAHWSNGFWVAKNGWEFPILLLAGSFAISLVGFGTWSLDAALDLTYPDWLLPAWLVLNIAGAAALLAIRATPRAPATEQAE